MRKQEFIALLRKKLSALPKRDVEERLAFYSEMIDDRMEEGLLEEDAVNAVGDVDEIALQITKEIPPVKERATNSSVNGWKVAFLILGSPIWFSLLVGAFAIAISLYAVLFAVVVTLWAVFVSLVAVGVAGVLVGIVFVFTSGVGAGLALVGAGLVCAGLSVFLFFGCTASTKPTLLLLKTYTQKLVAYGRRTHNG